MRNSTQILALFTCLGLIASCSSEPTAQTIVSGTTPGAVGAGGALQATGGVTNATRLGTSGTTVGATQTVAVAGGGSAIGGSSAIAIATGGTTSSGSAYATKGGSTGVGNSEVGNGGASQSTMANTGGANQNTEVNNGTVQTSSANSDGTATAGGSGSRAAGGTSASTATVSGTGGTAAGGTSAGTTGGTVTPTKVSGTNKYRFNFSDVVFEVDQQIGGKVATLSFGGTNLVVPTAADNTQWGSMFWTSLRADWLPTTWPPPAAYESSHYTVRAVDSHSVLTGPTETNRGISVSKGYAVNSAPGWITITYTINASKAVTAAPLEDTRVPRGGLAFFPKGSTLTKGPLTTITTAGGVVWFDDAAKTATGTSGSKAVADGSGGCSA